MSNVEGKMPPTSDLLQGTLDLLILRTLALESMHGWGIALRIQQVSKDALQIGQGSLYPALHRLEYKGWIRADWGASENNRRAKFYSLTESGKVQLRVELNVLVLALGSDNAAGTDIKTQSRERLRAGVTHQLYSWWAPFPRSARIASRYRFCKFSR